MSGMTVLNTKRGMATKSVKAQAGALKRKKGRESEKEAVGNGSHRRQMKVGENVLRGKKL
jgi:hypothetical protein